MSTALDRGLKRICGSCATRFYDMNKSPIACPKCGEEFTGAVRVKTRRSRIKVEAEEKVSPKTAAKKNVAALEEEDEDDAVISLDDLEREENGDEDDAELEGDLDLDELANIDDDEEEDFDDDEDLAFGKVSTE